VCPFGVVELEGAGDCVEHGGRDAGQGTAFQLAVVLDADAGECGDFAATKSGHPAGADDGQAGLLRGDLGAPRDQELADLSAILHVNHGRRGSSCVGCLVNTPLIRHSHIG
jgi:hypothetical protein